MSFIFALLVIYQVKHWLADYPLQRPWMLGKFLEKGWVAPLAAHAGVHALFTLLIVLCCPGTTLLLAGLLGAFDFIIHFTMDRIKASSKLMGRWKPLSKTEFLNRQWQIESDLPIPEWKLMQEEARRDIRGNRLFWHALGIDQMVHHLTHYAIIFVLAYLN